MFDFTRSALVSAPVAPYRAIKGDTANNFQVLQATDGTGLGINPAGDVCIGISQKGEENSPFNSDGYAASPAGNALSVMYYGEGATDVAAQLGATVTAYQFLKSDANGKLIPATTTGDNYVARARQSGILNDIIAVDVIIGSFNATNQP